MSARDDKKFIGYQIVIDLFVNHVKSNFIEYRLLFRFLLQGEKIMRLS